MEEKCVKSAVYNLETVFKDSAEVPVDIDFTLPDYCPEISRILKCRTAARISSKSVEGQRISLEGSVTLTVIYADNENTVNSYEYQYPFSKTFEAGTDLSGAYVRVRLKTEYINCRPVTERKIDIHGAIGVYVTASSRKIRDIICDVEDENIEVLRVSAPATMPVGNADKYVLIEDEIEVGSSKPDIRCLIRYDSSVRIEECKLLDKKAIVKGEMSVNILYRGEDGELESLEGSIPFSQLVDIEGAGEDCECRISADVAYLEVKPKANSSSAARAFSVDGKILLTAEAYKSRDIDVVTDAYSTMYEANVSGEEICFNRLVCNINDTFNCRKELDFPSGSIERVYDVWCIPGESSTEFEGDCLTVSGNAVCGILALNEEGAPVYYEKPVEFDYRYKMSCPTDNLSVQPEISVISTGYTISGDSRLEIRLEMAVNAAVYECSEINLVNNISIDENKPISKSDSAALTVYFAESGENVWEIARRYLANTDEIRRLNELDGDQLTQTKMLLIPTK